MERMPGPHTYVDGCVQLRARAQSHDRRTIMLESAAVLKAENGHELSRQPIRTLLASAAFFLAAGGAQAQTGQNMTGEGAPYGTHASGNQSQHQANTPGQVATHGRKPPLHACVQRTDHVLGIGLSEQDRAASSSYPVALKTVGGYGQWLGNQDITISARGRQIAAVHCQGPWLLMKLEPGSYRATVRVQNAAAKTVTFNVPRSGRREVMVRFPRKMEGRDSQQPHSLSMEHSGTR